MFNLPMCIREQSSSSSHAPSMPHPGGKIDQQFIQTKLCSQSLKHKAYATCAQWQKHV